MLNIMGKVYQIILYQKQNWNFFALTVSELCRRRSVFFALLWESLECRRVVTHCCSIFWL